jgi:hypothetical protein
MDGFLRILGLMIIGGGVAFVIFAWAKGWFKGVRRGSFTSQVTMHDWLNKDKQHAMEYVIDEEEEKERKDASSGENKEPGCEKNGAEDTP